MRDQKNIHHDQGSKTHPSFEPERRNVFLVLKQTNIDRCKLFFFHIILPTVEGIKDDNYIKFSRWPSELRRRVLLIFKTTVEHAFNESYYLFIDNSKHTSIYFTLSSPLFRRLYIQYHVTYTGYSRCMFAVRRCI